MQWSVTVVVEIGPEAEIGQMEQAVLEAGRQAMREALKQAVRASEGGHAACPGCGSALSRSWGGVRAGEGKLAHATTDPLIAVVAGGAAPVYTRLSVLERGRAQTQAQ